jgi:homoserine acetyltransferase
LYFRTLSRSYKDMPQDLFARKKHLGPPDPRSAAGAAIRHVAMGFETYGALNEARDNALLAAHCFSPRESCAGKRRPRRHRRRARSD